MDLGSLIPTFNAARLESESIRKPSKETLKNIQIEIQTALPPDHVYTPGETVQGVFKMVQLGDKPIHDVYFNDLEITLVNRFVTSNGQDASFFQMEDNPNVSSFPPMCHDPDKYAFSNCEFPFKFTLPMKHLEDTCVNALPEHRQLLPSYGLPSLCGIAFAPRSVAGLVPTDVQQTLQKLKKVSQNKFCNTYYISVKVKQNVKGLGRPYIVFTRSMEVKVKTSNHMTPECPTINKGTTIKCHDAVIGKVSVESPTISTDLRSESPLKVPIEITYEPAADTSEFPQVRLSFELNQYAVQTARCNPPIVIGEEGNQDDVLVQKVDTIYCASEASVSGTWTPSYFHQGQYIQNVEVSIPMDNFKSCSPTFHSCHLQNILNAEIRVGFNTLTSSPEEITTKKKRWPFGTVMFNSKKTVAEKDTSSYRGVSQPNGILLRVPVMVQ